MVGDKLRALYNVQRQLITVKLFYRASSYASAALGVVRYSVVLSVTGVLCDKTKQ